MNICLMGSVSSSWTTLNALSGAGIEVTAVLGVRPDKAKRVSDYRDLEPLAHEVGVPYLGFGRVSEREVTAFIDEHPADMLWVIGLSQLVPARILDRFPAGGVGFHPTLLPMGRGRAPVAWTLLLGARAAVNLFYLTDDADAGDIIIQREVPVLPDDYAEDLIDRTNAVLHQCVSDLAPQILAGNLPRNPQDHSRATHYEKRTPEDGLICWADPTDRIYRLVRAAGRPYPGAFTRLGDRRLIIWRARPEGFVRTGIPGTVLAVEKESLVIETADGALRTTDAEWNTEPLPVAVGTTFDWEPTP